MNFKRFRKQIIIIFDAIVVLFVSQGVFLFLSIDNISYKKSPSSIIYIMLLFMFILIFNIILKTYNSLWRYAESKEYLTLLVGYMSGCLLFIIFNLLFLKSEIPCLIAITISAVSLLIILLSRFSYRLYRTYEKVNKSSIIEEKKIPLIIIGAGSTGVRLLDEINEDKSSKYKPIFFIDDNIEKIGKFIHGVEVKGPISNLTKLLSEHDNNEIIIAIPSLSAEKRKVIIDICTSLRFKVKVITGTLDMAENVIKSVRDIKIDDLLGREPIVFGNNDVYRFLKDKTVLVTGGGGSIGSELCRQIAYNKPKKLIIIDIYENNAYEIQQELINDYSHNLSLSVEIADIVDQNKMDFLFNKYRPNIIFHAAAHKHVPFMEDCPEEAIKNNIFGTYNVIKLADKWNVEKFVLISTDKAVNPTNVMGASKRFCEMMIRSMKNRSKTNFVAVRFGNVLGSNGSVIPLFLKQIDRGGPVTVTDKRMVRYFMTIPEAAQLVLQAGSIADKSEIFVLDMGEPVKIIDLAENLIKLTGHIPYKEIPILETGLRKGEKLYEEILLDYCNKLSDTNNNKIFIEEDEDPEIDVENYLKILKVVLDTRNYLEIKAILKHIVPTYKDPEEVNNLYCKSIEEEIEKDSSSNSNFPENDVFEKEHELIIK